MREIHRSPVNSPHKGQWRGALMFSLICVRINDWVHNRESGDLIRYRAHYDVIVMIQRTKMVVTFEKSIATFQHLWTYFNTWNVKTCSETLKWCKNITQMALKWDYLMLVFNDITLEQFCSEKNNKETVTKKLTGWWPYDPLQIDIMCLSTVARHVTAMVCYLILWHSSPELTYLAPGHLKSMWWCRRSVHRQNQPTT